VESTPPENATITELNRREDRAHPSELGVKGWHLDTLGLEQVGGEITLAGVAENNDDDFSQDPVDRRGLRAE